MDASESQMTPSQIEDHISAKGATTVRKSTSTSPVSRVDVPGQTSLYCDSAGETSQRA
jgi:hypothetical protein